MTSDSKNWFSEMMNEPRHRSGSKNDAEKGFVKIPNCMLERLMKTKLSSADSRVLFCIIRQTIGWGKDDDWIALSQFVQKTGIKKPHVCRALGRLLQRNIILKTGKKYRVNFDIQQWLSL